MNILEIILAFVFAIVGVGCFLFSLRGQDGKDNDADILVIAALACAATVIAICWAAKAVAYEIIWGIGFLFVCAILASMKLRHSNLLGLLWLLLAIGTFIAFALVLKPQM